MNEIAAKLGEVGLPAPVSELAAREWDAVVVGGGHNGLTAAAYLAREGQSVLVLERRERLGGACTLERPFSDERFVISPCAYVVGLLDELVIRELDLRRRGFECYVADPNLWVPFDDGTSFAQWLDPAKTQANLEAIGVVEEGHRRLLGLRGDLRRHPPQAAHRRARLVARRDADARRDRGDARPRRSDDRHRLRRVDRRRPRRAMSPTSGSRTPSSARRSSPPTAGRRIPAPRRSSSCTTRATSKARARCGATSRAAWA